MTIEESRNTLEVNVFLCDSVVVADNKVFAQGAVWDSIVAPAIPFVHPRVGVALALHVPWALTNQIHEFKVSVLDPDGARMTLADDVQSRENADPRVREIHGRVNVGRPSVLASGDDQVVPVALNLDQLEFTKAGRYRVVVDVNGDRAREVSFNVRAAIVAAPRTGPRYV